MSNRRKELEDVRRGAFAHDRNGGVGCVSAVFLSGRGSAAPYLRRRPLNPHWLSGMLYRSGPFVPSPFT